MKSIYIIDTGERVKIGISKVPERRILDLENSGGFTAIQTYISECPYAEKLEKQVLDDFSDYRVNGEWFENVSFHKIYAYVTQGVNYGMENITENYFVFPGSDLVKMNFKFYSKLCKFNKKLLVINLWDGDGWYEVDLEECTSSESFLDWVYHLKHKGWCTPDLISDFLLCFEAAFEEIFSNSDFYRFINGAIEVNWKTRTISKRRWVAASL
ncbi:MAG: hypothetical protein DRR19_13375 [Candidatus Parabeggiatoa sp. nov. 1]|nr:MAG: hypothetical protein DRR19_13375 [Gammaproteobacteria bacterium]